MSEITDEQLAEWERLAKVATPGPWRWWTSNSFRRLSSDATGKDGDVLSGDIQRSDGHPDVLCSEEDRAFIAAARSAMPALLAEVRRLRADEGLYTEPAWRVEARTWLVSFRTAAVAAGLPWVAPDLCDERENIAFWWLSGKTRLDVGKTHLDLGWSTMLGIDGGSAPIRDLPACVDLYRRWLTERKE